MPLTKPISGFLCLTFLLYSSVFANESLPFTVGEFPQEAHMAYTTANGLGSNSTSQISLGQNNEVIVQTEEGVSEFREGRWFSSKSEMVTKNRIPAIWHSSLLPLVKSSEEVRGVAQHGKEIAIAAKNGLYVGDGSQWTLVMPTENDERWAPIDVRAVTYDAQGHLWFAAPQGVGYRIAQGEWRLFTGEDGLPFADFTSMAAGPDGVWFGTTNGAVHFRNDTFEYRQGRRWLLDNHVNDVVVDAQGTAWFATNKGVSSIVTTTTSLSDKASKYLADIDLYHRYTPFGYVSWAYMDEPGAKETAKARFTDNDGHYTGKYLGMASLAYAATKDPKHKSDAQKAFKAIAFLSEVTEGGTHPAPKGFIARTIRSTKESDPNPDFDHSYDVKRNKRDSLWKLIQPRWPIDESGDWYWKCDSSSDELDGHFFGYGIYYDRACETEKEKEEVRVVVRRVMDHILDNNWSQIDHDGLPTRWGDFSPEKLNQHQFWWVERGLKSLSILAYLSVTHHITEDQKYRDAFLELAIEHGYAMNGMTQPKVLLTPGAMGQGDDNMAFMNYYHLMRYETDPHLQGMFNNAIYWHWQVEQYERNPFLNMVYAACNLGKVRPDQWRDQDLSPTEDWLENTLFTLKRFPVDLVDWPMSNAHRLDVIPLRPYTRGPVDGSKGAGYRNDGFTFPIDENHSVMSGNDPWALSRNTNGTRLNTGLSFLLPYYMGIVHGYINP
jgi:hypothetical protein